LLFFVVVFTPTVQITVLYVLYNVINKVMVLLYELSCDISYYLIFKCLLLVPNIKQ